jgi:hypothetical protein
MEELSPEALNAALAILQRDIADPGRLNQIFEIRNLNSYPEHLAPGEVTAELAPITTSLVWPRRHPMAGTLLPHASGERVDGADTTVPAIYRQLPYDLNIPTLVLRPGSDQLETTTSNMVLVRFPKDVDPERTYLGFIRRAAYRGRTDMGPVDQQKAVLHVGISEEWMPTIRPIKQP